MKINKLLIIFLIPVILISLILVFTVSCKDENHELIGDNDMISFEEGDSNVTESLALQKTLDVKIAKSINAAIPIFMYHFVRADTGDYEYPENMIHPEKLEAQLKYLKENGNTTIFINDLENIEYIEKPVALTFDDGWEDFYLYGFPLFKKYNLKATLYVITGLVGTPGYCNLDELREMKESGIVDIQCHTVTHPKLATLSREKIIEEITKSKECLKENLGIDSDTICYPYGSYNLTVIAESKNAGYTYGLAMTGGVYYTNKHKDIYQIPRIYAYRSMPMSEFKSYVNTSKVEVVWEENE